MSPLQNKLTVSDGFSFTGFSFTTAPDINSSKPATISCIPSPLAEDALIVPHGAAYIEVSGSLLFGAGELLEEALEDMSKLEPVQVGKGRSPCRSVRGGTRAGQTLVDCLFPSQT